MRELPCGKHVLACDLGASSGRVMAAGYDGARIHAREVHRFRNAPALVNGTLYWDILNILSEIKSGLAAGAAAAKIDSVGIDAWGVDFGMVGDDGQLLSGVVHYRDRRTDGYERLYGFVGREELYRATGIQEMQINSVFQLDSVLRGNPELFRLAKDILFVPDLLNYFLTGSKSSEYTIASTSGLLDVRSRDWDRELMGKVGLPAGLFRDIVMPGAVCGPLSEEVRKEMALPPMKVVHVAAHDTASAVFAASAMAGASDAPEKNAVSAEGAVFLSCGTWCLLGRELDEPCATDKAMRCGFTNEGGVGGRILFMKNIPGTWLVQECVRRWSLDGRRRSYGDLDAQAGESPPFRSVIDVEDPAFVSPDDMAGAIAAHCAKAAQPIPSSEGAFVRCIYEGLAFRVRRVIKDMEDCTGHPCKSVHMIGGGVKSPLLCQIVADVAGRPVIAGSAEATALGNAAAQLMADGEFADEGQARQALAASGGNVRYEPNMDGGADDGYGRYIDLCKRRPYVC